MGFLDKLTNTISSTGKGVEQKAKMMSGTVKLNSQIKELNEYIAEYMRQIGELYYKKQEGISDDPDIADLFQKIQNCEAEICEAEKQIDTLKGICRCKNCGAEMHLTDNFCMMCGTKREEEEPQMLEETTVDGEAVVTDISEEKTEEAEVEEIEVEEAEVEEAEAEVEEVEAEETEVEETEQQEEDKTEKEEEGIDPSEFEI